MLKGKKCPRAGLRVKADPNAVSMAMYSPGHGPTPGATGTVEPVSTGRGKKTCIPGPGGGLVYVKWDDGRTFGVSRYDIAKSKGKAVVMQASPAVYGLGGANDGLGHDPLHNETVLKNYGKCLRKCKRKPHVGPCIDACLAEHPAPGHEALGSLGVKPYWRPKGQRSKRGYDDITEADEVKDKTTALANLREKLLQYARGVETMGVLTMYENAARRAGATSEEIQEQRAMVQRTLHSVDGLGMHPDDDPSAYSRWDGPIRDAPSGPDEDDVTTTDHKHWYQSGKLYFTGDEGGLQAKMHKDNFWPNVWFISDHGNAHLIVLR